MNSFLLFTSLFTSSESIILQTGFSSVWLLLGLIFTGGLIYFFKPKKARKLKLAFDVHYKADRAKSVCALFEKWDDKSAKSFKIKYIDEVEKYVPGQFYKRELPCIMTILDDLDLSEIETIVIDGFVVLDDDGKAGLGQYLYEKLNRKIPIIGIAKTGFHNNVKNVKQVFRGESKKPLYVTAAGMDIHEAAMLIQDMSGDYRMPDILREVDFRTKEG